MDYRWYTSSRRLYFYQKDIIGGNPNKTKLAPGDVFNRHFDGKNEDGRALGIWPTERAMKIGIRPTAAVFVPQKSMIHPTKPLFTMIFPIQMAILGYPPLPCWDKPIWAWWKAQLLLIYIPISCWFIPSPNQVRIYCWFINVYNTYNVVTPKFKTRPIFVHRTPTIVARHHGFLSLLSFRIHFLHGNVYIYIYTYTYIYIRMYTVIYIYN